MDINQGHVFLVEDDASLAELVKDYFQRQGFTVSVEGQGDKAIARILAAKPDLIILDIMLPGKNGLDICRELRPQLDTPILMLTARTDDIDQIVGLEVGADDYLCKPVKPRLLLAKVNATLRREAKIASQTSAEEAVPAPSQVTAPGVIKCGALTVNKNKQEVFLADQAIELTTNELELLYQFAAHADQILSRDDLLNTLRGFGYDGLDRTVDMLVSRLRKKLGDNSTKPTKIKTVWKKGYLFVADAWQ
ncbi:response regulator [Thalassotalea euphylliae]|uniref:Response regulator n=1 Tax=Thalassotalea euphylliae TaxID=1655234 RepID=A0A3E0TNX5_9GAMM|nr:response regulator [Thalassotalea euphylliae]REL25782.1 response regulator [Thalassotalea euphylliae]